MNKLSTKKRPEVLGLLVENMSLRAASRLSGCSFNTVTKLLVDDGKSCATYHDENVRGLTCHRVWRDLIRSFACSG